MPRGSSFAEHRFSVPFPKPGRKRVCSDVQFRQGCIEFGPGSLFCSTSVIVEEEVRQVEKEDVPLDASREGSGVIPDLG